MFKRSREMCAQHSDHNSSSGNGSCRHRQYGHSTLLTILFTLLLLISTTTASNKNDRRRTVLEADPATETAAGAAAAAALVPDQIALAASRTTNQQRRSGIHSYAIDGSEASGPADYAYSNLELNLVRPESEQLHTQITAKYTSSIGGGNGALEDSQTAEEYVAKAMQMHGYGARLREPIRIPSSEIEQTQTQQLHQQQQQQQQPSSHALEVQQQSQLQQQQQQQQQPHQEASQQNEAANYYYSYAQQQQEQHQQLQQQKHLIELQQHQQQQHQQQQQQQEQIEVQQQDQQQLQPQQIDSESDAKLLLEAKLQAQLQAQMQQAQQIAEQQMSGQADRDPARSYEVYDEATGPEGTQQVDRYYRTKYLYQPQSQQAAGTYRGSEEAAAGEERLRVSASTEIPKAEIMKQIEKSVIKYMKELEAEGKIITAPQTPQEPKGSYYKVLTVPVLEHEKHISSTTTKPKYPSSSTTSYHSTYNNGGSGGGGASTPSGAGRHHVHHHQSQSPQASTKYHTHKATHYQPEAESQVAVAAPPQEITDALAPNVEFIYKIKTRAPLQTATVKTVSKPYTLALKNGAYEHNPFDHSAAIKNMEEFDLSHVVTQEPEERPSSVANVLSATGKPNKLYFNSDVYQDINSLPYKPEKTRSHGPHSVVGEYRKVKVSDMGPDYKGYSGYFAEPAPDTDKEVSSAASSDGEDGYPLVNPYQYVLKKEPQSSSGSNKYEDDNSWEQLPRAGHGVHGKTALYATLSSDSYNPKYNNNPEGYGYQQHSYKSLTGGNESQRYSSGSGRHTSSNGSGGSAGSSGGSGKRGKRGGAAAPHTNKKGGLRMLKGGDMEANLALRPPPKVKV